MSKLLSIEDDKSRKGTHRALEGIQIQLMKSTILVSTSILSTWVFIFIGNFAWFAIGWFISLDMAINSTTVYLMFGFSENIYNLLCGPCVRCCKVCMPHPNIQDVLAGHHELQSRSINTIPTTPTTPSS